MALFVGRVPPDLQRRELADIFEKYGRTTRVDIRAGYAFVTFEDEADAADAKEGLNERELEGGLNLNIEWSKHSGRFEGERGEGYDHRDKRDLHDVRSDVRSRSHDISRDVGNVRSRSHGVSRDIRGHGDSRDIRDVRSHGVSRDIRDVKDYRPPYERDHRVRDHRDRDQRERYRGREHRDFDRNYGREYERDYQIMRDRRVQESSPDFRSCFKCGDKGHIARDCFREDQSYPPVREVRQHDRYQDRKYMGAPVPNYSRGYPRDDHRDAHFSARQEPRNDYRDIHKTYRVDPREKGSQWHDSREYSDRREPHYRPIPTESRSDHRRREYRRDIPRKHSPPPLYRSEERERRHDHEPKTYRQGQRKALDDVIDDMPSSD